MEDRLTPSKTSLTGGLLDANRLLDPQAAGGLLSDPLTGQSGANASSGSVTPTSSTTSSASGSGTLTSGSTTTATTGAQSTSLSSSSTTSSTSSSDYLVASASLSSSSTTSSTSTSRWSPSSSTTLVAPTSLTAAAQDTTQITLNWQYSSSGQSGFKVLRSKDDVNFSKIATVGSTVFSYTNTGLTAGTTYYYEIKAYSGKTTSAASNVASDVARGAATHFQATSASTTVTAGTAFTVTADALDSYNNVAVGYRGTASFSSSDAQAALPANYTYTSNDLGVHSFSVTLNTAGTQSVTATDTATSTITGTLSGITVSSGDPLVISGLASTQTAGTAGSFTVKATDSSGNVNTGYAGTVTFSSSDSKAVLPANYTFTSADAGVHSFNVTFKTAGTQSLTASDTVDTTNTVTQSGITVNAAAATTLSVTGFPSPSTVGTAGNFTVTAKDTYGNVVTGYTGTVKFSSSDLLASLPANYTFTSTDAGVHSFTATLNTVGSQSITSTDTVTATITGTQSNITVNAVSTSPSFLVSGFPTSINAGVSGTFTVTALNADGTVNTGYTGSVAFASSSQSATLPSAYTFTTTDLGVHTFTATLNIAGTQSLTVVDCNNGWTGAQSAISVTQVQGKTYYVSISGSDSNAGTLAAPFLTINHGVSVLNAGDTLYVRGGTYTESLDDAIPGGTSWSAPVTVAAYQNETVTLKAPSGSGWVLHFSSSASQYIIVSGLHLDATNVTYDAVKITDNDTSAASHIRLINDEIKSVPASTATSAKIGVLITVNTTKGLYSNYNELINTTVHDIGGVSGAGNDQEGIYIQSNYNLFDGVETYNCSSYGLQFYDGGGPTDGTVCSNNTVRNSKFHNDAIATGSGSGEVLVGMGQNNLLYNNRIYDGLGGVKISYGAASTQFLNNTIYGNSNFNYGGLYIDGATSGYSAPSATVVKNNILYQNGTDYSNSGTNTTSDYNMTGDGTAVGTHSKKNANPLFVNATATTPDFHLQSTSPAIDAGVASTQVPVDADGLTRPQGTGYCIGAYEYA